MPADAPQQVVQIPLGDTGETMLVTSRFSGAFQPGTTVRLVDGKPVREPDRFVEPELQTVHEQRLAKLPTCPLCEAGVPLSTPKKKA